MESKKKLRQNILEERKYFNKNYNVCQNNIIVSNTQELLKSLTSNIKTNNRLARDPLLNQAYVIGLYYPIQGEPDIVDLFDGGNNIVALPKIVKSTINFVRYKNGMEFEDSSFNNLVHPKNNDVLLPDIIVVPALAFSLSGVRLGFGNGYYDRYFSSVRNSPVKIGVCFHHNLHEYLPYEGHDVTMDYIITDKIIIEL